MTETLTKIVANCTTKEIEVVPLTNEEIAQHELDLNSYLLKQEQLQAEALAKAEAKASAEAKLAALGLTPEEIAALR